MEDHILLNINSSMAQFFNSLETLMLGVMVGVLISAVAYWIVSSRGHKKELTAD